jgi:hypothetical protein
MSALEIKKAEAERARVYSARLDLELKLEEMKESITRIENNIKIQIDKESELEAKILKLKGE